MHRRWQAAGQPNTPLALYLDVDFELQRIEDVLEKRYLALLNAKQISEEELNVIIRERNNVVMEYKITVEVIK